MIRSLAKALQITVTVVVILIALLLEDLLCWRVPFALSRCQTSTIQSRCSQVEPGITREQAIAIMHKGFTPREEWEESKRGPLAVHDLRFWSPGGSCTVQVDSTSGFVAAVRFDNRFDALQ